VRNCVSAKGWTWSRAEKEHEAPSPLVVLPVSPLRLRGRNFLSGFEGFVSFALQKKEV